MTYPQQAVKVKLTENIYIHRAKYILRWGGTPWAMFGFNPDGAYRTPHAEVVSLKPKE